LGQPALTTSGITSPSRIILTGLRIRSNRPIQYPVIEYPVIEYPVIEYPVIEYPVIEYPVIEYPVIEYPVP
jgi:hypothetical protein